MKRRLIRKTCLSCGNIRAHKSKVSTKCFSCFSADADYATDESYLRRSLLRSAARRAKKKGRDYSLSIEWATERIKACEGRCEATGILMVRPKGRGEDRWNSPSIDRIDSSLGYTEDNCRFVIWAFNNMKARMPDDRLAMICREFLKRYENSE